jgi:hypothetical protein
MASMRPRTRKDGSTFWEVLLRHDGRQRSLSFETVEHAGKFKDLVGLVGPGKALAAYELAPTPRAANGSSVTVAEWVEHLGALQQGVQVIERPAQPAAALPGRGGHRTAGVTQHCLGLGHRGLGDIGQLCGDAQDGGLALLIGNPVGVMSAQGQALRGLMGSNCRIESPCGRGLRDPLITPFLWCEGLVAYGVTGGLGSEPVG